MGSNSTLKIRFKASKTPKIEKRGKLNEQETPRLGSMKFGAKKFNFELPSTKTVNNPTAHKFRSEKQFTFERAKSKVINLVKYQENQQEDILVSEKVHS
jgi:hypothetical protein